MCQAASGLHTAFAPLRHVRVDLRRLHVLVTQELLHRADVVAALEEVGRDSGAAPETRTASR